MKLLGMVFIVSSAAYGGIAMAQDLRRRCRILRQITSALELMRSELSYCGTPLPKVFALMAAASEGVVAAMFSSVAKCMDKFRWITPDACMRRVMSEQTVISRIPGIPDTLLQLCATLGSYDLDHQLRGIDLAASRINQMIVEVDQELKGKCRMYRTIGVCAGLALAILLV